VKQIIQSAPLYPLALRCFTLRPCVTFRNMALPLWARQCLPSPHPHANGPPLVDLCDYWFSIFVAAFPFRK
jgi:hypothetical protein